MDLKLKIVLILKSQNRLYIQNTYANLKYVITKQYTFCKNTKTKVCIKPITELSIGWEGSGLSNEVK